MKYFFRVLQIVFLVIFFMSCHKDNDDAEIENSSYFPSLIDDYSSSDNTLTFNIHYNLNNFGSASVIYKNISNPNNEIFVNEHIFNFNNVEGQTIEINEAINSVYPGVKTIDLNNSEEEFDMYNPSPVILALNESEFFFRSK